MLLAIFLVMKVGTELVTRPYFWETANYGKAGPLSGTYVLSEDVGANSGLAREQMRNVRFILNSDHSAVVNQVPGVDGWGDLESCTWSGTGKWNPNGGQAWIEIDRTGRAPGTGCDQNYVDYTFILMTKHRLWLAIGDPDNGEGLIFTRQSTN